MTALEWGEVAVTVAMLLVLIIAASQLVADTWRHRR